MGRHWLQLGLFNICRRPLTAIPCETPCRSSRRKTSNRLEHLSVCLWKLECCFLSSGPGIMELSFFIPFEIKRAISFFPPLPQFVWQFVVANWRPLRHHPDKETKRQKFGNNRRKKMWWNKRQKRAVNMIEEKKPKKRKFKVFYYFQDVLNVTVIYPLNVTHFPVFSPVKGKNFRAFYLLRLIVVVVLFGWSASPTSDESCCPCCFGYKVQFYILKV